ncbi:hypothetical protein [Nocardioides massiliensis]|uniref:Protein ImuA n=1 Tax=Nocardioides massiliensis TaxID=1325935 RepID=A0ABT9NRX5_9ACTN|nr:hypothetical protein [Nocardioides massiliensis]MDP9822929.1 hypothetical protein [Nocardioides massiliensis]
MSAAPDLTAPALVAQLRERIGALEGAPARTPLPTYDAFAPLIQLRAGGTYVVDAASVALALVAGASAGGEWVGVLGWPDLGAEAAHDLGADLSRVVLVPDPGGLWLEAAAALIDVVRLVVLRPAGPVDPKSVAVLDARLRKRSAALVVWGEWPRCEARLSLERVSWTGPGRGSGRLAQRRAEIAVRRGGAPPARGGWVVSGGVVS